MSLGGSGRRTWYALESAPTGADQLKFARLCVIKCCKCDKVSSERQAGLNDDALRRKFIAKGWSIGKRANLHLCPEHSRKHDTRPHVTSTVVEMRTLVTPAAATGVQMTDEMREALKHQAIVVRPDGTWTTLAQHMDEAMRQALSARPISGPIMREIQDEIEPDPNVPNAEDEEVADLIFGKGRR